MSNVLKVPESSPRPWMLIHLLLWTPRPFVGNCWNKKQSTNGYTQQTIRTGVGESPKVFLQEFVWQCAQEGLVLPELVNLKTVFGILIFFDADVPRGLPVLKHFWSLNILFNKKKASWSECLYLTSLTYGNFLAEWAAFCFLWQMFALWQGQGNQVQESLKLGLGSYTMQSLAAN